MTTATKERKFNGTVSVCAHQVAFRYWEIGRELTADLEVRLTSEAEERAQDCIIEGYREGELNCLDPESQEEIRGWWEIDKS